jgi:hypothetical protein
MVAMGPSSKPKNKPVFVPHPNDEAEVRDAFEAVDRGEVLSPEESAAYLRALLGDKTSDE